MERIFQRRVVPVTVFEHAEDAVHTAEALQGAGLDIIEIPLRTPASLDAIRAVRVAFPDMLLGVWVPSFEKSRCWRSWTLESTSG